MREIETSDQASKHVLNRPLVRVLGSIEVVVAGSRYPLRPMARRLLAVLAAARGRVVRVDRVIDLLWPEVSPASAAKTLQTHVVHLRRAVGQSSVIYRSAGYALALDVVQLDSAELERCMERADRDVRAGRFEDAFDNAWVAMSLVCGTPFDEFATEEFASAEVARLSELGARSVELGADCAARLGRASAMVGALESLVRAEPLRESAWAKLLFSLVASGRPGDAIRAAERAIDVLREELGAVPGRELAEQIELIRPQTLPSSGKTTKRAGGLNMSLLSVSTLRTVVLSESPIGIA
jgi:DNA-binding SARP family transcriptional activator